MELIISTFGVLFALAVGTFFLVLPVGLVIWAMKRHSKRKETFARTAGTLGLTLKNGQLLVGARNGVLVDVAHVTEGHGDNRSNHTYVDAAIDPPLRLGLSLRSQGWMGSALGEVFGKGLTLGDPAFDRDFRVSAAERDGATALLIPEARRALAEIRSRYQSLSVVDDEVRIKFSGWIVDAHRLGLALDAVARLSAGLAAARRAMGPTERERAVVDIWGQVAAQAGWAFHADELSLTGAVEGVTFQVVPTLSSSGWSTRFRVSLGRPLGVDLQLRKEGSLAAVGRFLGFHDIRVGDPRFDDAFSIKGSNADAVRHVLGDPALREQLLTLLKSARTLTAGDDYVEAIAHGLIDQPPALRSSLEMVAGVAVGLRARVDAPSVGAYR